MTAFWIMLAAWVVTSAAYVLALATQRRQRRLVRTLIDTNHHLMIVLQQAVAERLRQGP